MTKRTSKIVLCFFTPIILFAMVMEIFVVEKSILKKVLPLIGSISFLGFLWLNHFKIIGQEKTGNHKKQIN